MKIVKEMVILELKRKALPKIFLCSAKFVIQKARFQFRNLLLMSLILFLLPGCSNNDYLQPDPVSMMLKKIYKENKNFKIDNGE